MPIDWATALCEVDIEDFWRMLPKGVHISFMGFPKPADPSDENSDIVFNVTSVSMNAGGYGMWTELAHEGFDITLPREQLEAFISYEVLDDADDDDRYTHDPDDPDCPCIGCVKDSM